MRPVDMRLHRASSGDSEWLQAVLDRVGRGSGSRAGLEPDGMLALRREWGR